MTNAITTDPYYIGRDLGNYPFNRIFPPDSSAFGNKYHGYASDNQEVFFYDFVVHSYGVQFTYNDIRYCIEGTELFPEEETTPLQLINLSDNNIEGTYDDPIDLLKHSMIQGKPLINLIDSFEDLEII